MPRRSIWSARQRAALFDLPTDEAALLRHYTLSDDDIEQIRVRRGGHNRLGFALQLCAFRYPGRLLVAGETIPLNVLRFIAAQLGRRADSGLSVRFCPLPESTPWRKTLYRAAWATCNCPMPSGWPPWLALVLFQTDGGSSRRTLFQESPFDRRQLVLPAGSIVVYQAWR